MAVSYDDSAQLESGRQNSKCEMRKSDAILAAHVQSLTVDEPYHLIAGFQSVRYGSNTVDYAHPALVKTVAALPLALTDPDLFPRTTPADALADSGRVFDDP